MQRKDLLEICSELMDVLNSKKISPQDAKSIAQIFQMSVEKSNELGRETYMKEGIFCGSSPAE